MQGHVESPCKVTDYLTTVESYPLNTSKFKKKRKRLLQIVYLKFTIPADVNYFQHLKIEYILFSYHMWANLTCRLLWYSWLHKQCAYYNLTNNRVDGLGSICVFFSFRLSDHITFFLATFI